MFKVLTYAYMNGIYTTQKIEQSCRRDINFLRLLGGTEKSTVLLKKQKTEGDVQSIELSSYFHAQITKRWRRTLT
ncbi:MAG: transposase [Mobilitalea sp.]